MAQLERVQRHADATSPTVEQLLRGGDASKVSPISSSSSPFSPSLGHRLRHTDPEEDQSHHQQKKSVLTKVKEKARKLRYTLSKKKYDDNVTPSWGVSLDEDDDEEEDDDDPEYLGAPMYESELAPEAYKENARQHPRATPVISEKHVLASTVKQVGGEGLEQNRFKPLKTTERIIEPIANSLPPPSPRKKLTENVADNAKEPYVTSKIQGLTISKPTEYQFSFSPVPAARQTYLSLSPTAPFPLTPPPKMASQVYSSTPVTPRKNTGSRDQAWDEALPPGDAGVMEKVNDEPSQYNASKTPTTHTSTTSRIPVSSTQIPVSANAYEAGREENHGRILQAN